MKTYKVTNLRIERLERGLSQYDVAFGCGVPQVLISYGERGYPVLKKKHKAKIAVFFGLKISELFPEETKG